MGWIALRMLTGDKVKYYGLIFGIAFSTLLIAQQSTLFVNLMLRASAAVWDVTDADIWVMDQRAQTDRRHAPSAIDRPLPGPRRAGRRVGGADAAPGRDGANAAGRRWSWSASSASTIARLIGLPRRIVRGNLGDLAAPDAMFIDEVGSRKLFPDAARPGRRPGDRAQRSPRGDPRRRRCESQLHLRRAALHPI
jgi:putative ABC transport system permease protein